MLLEADYVLKEYSQGRDRNQNFFNSSVPTYKSTLRRWAEIGAGGGVGYASSRLWIEPEYITLKRDNNSKSFIFDDVKMRVGHEALYQGNPVQWNQAHNEFAQDMTDHYDQYAQEIPSWYETKQLAKIVSVVKWIKDNNIASDFEWARDYQPAFVDTPTELPRLSHATTQAGTEYSITGGVQYYAANTYNSDDGTAVNLKNAAQAQSDNKEDVHWTFTHNSIEYDAVAVEASAFRNIGAYNTSVTDSLPL